MKLLVREGDSVRKGQVLVQLADPQVKARVGQTRCAVAALQTRVKAFTAAKLLGLSRPTLHSKIEKYGFKLKTFVKEQ